MKRIEVLQLWGANRARPPGCDLAKALADRRGEHLTGPPADAGLRMVVPQQSQKKGFQTFPIHLLLSIVIFFFYLLVSIFRGRHLWDWTLMSEYDWCKKIHEQWNPWGFKSWSPQNGVKDALGCHKWKIWTSEKVFSIGQLDVLRKIVVSCSSKPPEGCGFDQREVGTIGWIWMNGEYQPRKPALHCQCWPRCLAGMFFCMVLVGIPTYISGFAWKIGAASIPMDDYYPHQVVHSGGITLFSDTLLSKWMGDA